MSLPAIYEFFNAEGACVVDAHSDAWAWNWPQEGEELFNEALAAVFKLAALAIKQDAVNTVKNHKIQSVAIEGVKVEFEKLREHIASGNAKIGMRHPIFSGPHSISGFRSISDDDENVRNDVALITAVFPELMASP
jgi:hypothetical protein